jgi:hypothetical protein
VVVKYGTEWLVEIQERRDGLLVIHNPSLLLVVPTLQVAKASVP